MLTPQDRALVVEDVVTTGLSVREVIDVVRKHGAQVAGVGIIVQRGDADFGVPTHALAEYADRIVRCRRLPVVHGG